MNNHKIGTREQWLAARLELLEDEKALTRRSDKLAQMRQELPWYRIEKEYRFDTDEGTSTLADLFGGRSQLLVYHFMFAPDYTAGCPTCSAIADGFSGSVVHLANHDVTLCAVWASSFGGDFNYDFHVSHAEDEWRSGAVDYNFRTVDFRLPEGGEENPFIEALTSSVGTDWPTYRKEGPGMSAFALEDGVVYHTYSTYERGVDAIWGMYPWLDRAPLGRNETGLWWRRHDEYEGQ
jgi:predicted dithiol-disulfide oxidoreductase (DUF899 family)